MPTNHPSPESDATALERLRRVPEQYSIGGDRHNAQKAWLDGFDTAALAADRERRTPDDCDGMLQSVLMMLGLPGHRDEWFDAEGNWDFGGLRKNGLDARLAEIRVAESALRASRRASDAPRHEGKPHPDCPRCHGSGKCDNAQFRCICRWHYEGCALVHGRGDCDCASRRAPAAPIEENR